MKLTEKRRERQDVFAIGSSLPRVTRKQQHWLLFVYMLAEGEGERAFLGSW